MKEPLLNLILKVEFLLGSDLSTVSHELCELAKRIGVTCEGKFNGVVLIAHPFGDGEEALVINFHNATKSDLRYKLATNVLRED